MPLTILDVIVIVVLLISAILAMVRGFVREVLSIAAWVIAAACAYFFYDDLLPIISPYIENEQIAIIVSAALIFFVALIIATYITIRIADLVIDSRAGPVDRLLGFIFGAVRGVLLVVIAFQFFLILSPTRPTWVTEAKSTPILDSVREVLLAMLPKELADSLRQSGGDAAEAAPEASPPAVVTPAPPAAAGVTPAPTPPGGVAPVDRQRLDQLFGAPSPPPAAPAAPAGN